MKFWGNDVDKVYDKMFDWNHDGVLNKKEEFDKMNWMTSAMDEPDDFKGKYGSDFNDDFDDDCDFGDDDSDCDDDCDFGDDDSDFGDDF